MSRTTLWLVGSVIAIVGAAATPSPALPAASRPKTHLVSSVKDGDTIELDNGDAARLVGIDAPDYGECGFERAQARLSKLADGRQVTLKAPVDNRDQYGRLLRYVQVGSKDAGLRMIRSGLAIAAYDSRDGYDHHPREALYHRVDDASPDVGC